MRQRDMAYRMPQGQTQQFDMPQAPAQQPAPMPAPMQQPAPRMGPDASQLFGNLMVLRPNEEGHSYGTQYGMPINSMHAAGVGRYDLVDGGTGTGFQAGDMVLTQGLQAPPPTEGGNWMFSGKSMIGGRGNSGDDDYMAADQEQGQWIYQPQQQAGSEDRAPRETQNPEFVPPALDIYDESPEGWDRYRNIARAEAEGLNRMPFTFAGSDAAYIPTDKQSAFEMFYPSNLQGYQNYFRNPLLESDMPPASLDSTGVSKPKEKDPYLTEPYINPLFR